MQILQLDEFLRSIKQNIDTPHYSVQVHLLNRESHRQQTAFGIGNVKSIYRKTQVQLETLTIPSLRLSAELFSGGSIHKIYTRQRIAQRSTRILRKRHTQ
mgnify:CR=1 FL=1